MESDAGTLGPLPTLRPLGRISPSHFAGMEACALREVWAAAKEPAALPTTPAAMVGTVTHRLLEEAGRGDLSADAEPAIDRRWDELLGEAEVACEKSWLNCHFVPLASAVPDYEVRRLQALAAAKALARAAAATAVHRHGEPVGLPSGGEVAVSTPDGLAGGRIDVVTQTDEGPVLKDYKSGAIYERKNPRVVKQEYATQLKLYAAIYASMTGTWPHRLELVPIAGVPEEVPFTEEESQQLLGHALELREKINAIVSGNASLGSRIRLLADPDPGGCGYCPFRPHCPAYRAARRGHPDVPWPLDLWGRVSDLRLLGNGRRLLALETPQGAAYVRGIDARLGRHPALDKAVSGDRIGCYNLRPGGSPTTFAEGLYSTFYLEPSDMPIDAGS